MDIVAFDTETALISPGNLAPPLTCLSWADKTTAKAEDCGLLNYSDSCRWMQQKLTETSDILIGHNVAYDFAVLLAEDPKLLKPVFDAYRDDRVQDTRLNAKLVDIAKGTTFGRKYNLAVLAKRFLGEDLDKFTWRTGYGELRREPIEGWEPGAREYAKKDAFVTRQLSEHLGLHHNGAAQARGAWALHLMSCRGVLVDQEAVAKLRRRYTIEERRLQRQLLNARLLRVDGSKRDLQRLLGSFGGDIRGVKSELAERLLDYPLESIDTWESTGLRLARNMSEIKAVVQEVYGSDTPRTDSGAVSTSAETLSDISTYVGHGKFKRPFAWYRRVAQVCKVARYVSVQKMLSTYIRALKPIINPRYNPLVDTGRTSCGGTRKTEKNPATYSINVQNLPREPGVRECLVPRPGFVFCAVDYDTLELRALAHICHHMFGFSKLREALNAGMDPHLMVAAQLEGLSYQQALDAYQQGNPTIEKARSFAKIANFGFPGGLGSGTLVKFAKGWGVKLSLEEAIELKRVWRATWPEMARYFRGISPPPGRDKGDYKLPGSKRVRGNIFFTEACNYFFQGLAADGAKEALFDVAWECYYDEDSPLFGSHPVLFIHDEIIAEVPVEKAHEAAQHLASTMIKAMSKHIPSVLITAEPHLMARWYKGAKPVFDSDGRLIPWEPK